MDPLVRASIEKYDANFKLKPKQLECLNLLAKENRDVIVNLPVGYGKSLIFHLLPSLLGEKNEVLKPAVIVISPLNIIQNDQLTILKKHSISACKLDIEGKVNTLNTEDENGTFSLNCSTSMEEIENGNHSIILCHPEALLNTREGQRLLNSRIFQKHVVSVVVDECHIIEQW